MALLLDTHAFLWFVSGDKQLPARIKAKILDMSVPCHISVASLWELTIKKQIGKLRLDVSIDELFRYADRNRVEMLPITSDHLVQLSELPLHHNDPFDRLIISQAMVEDLTLVTRDKGLKNYGVRQEWG